MEAVPLLAPGGRVPHVHQVQPVQPLTAPTRPPFAALRTHETPARVHGTLAPVTCSDASTTASCCSRPLPPTCRQASTAVSLAVQEGSSLSRALSQESFFPPMMIHMVASGEVSGDLEIMLERSALNQERELEMTLGTIMGLFEPAMVVLMGGLVLTIVLAILLPIFDLNTMVR